jgi:hypothetical protein
VKIGGDIPIGGVILLPMIPGGDINHMQRQILGKRAIYLEKERKGTFTVKNQISI